MYTFRIIISHLICLLKEYIVICGGTELAEVGGPTAESGMHVELRSTFIAALISQFVLASEKLPLSP